MMSNLSILVVEDEALIAKSIKRSLEKNGYNVKATVNNAYDAIKLAETENPDLVLMDIHLKGDKNGIYAAERIWNEFKIPVVFLTAHSDQETFRTAKTTQPFGYITKPFDEKQLEMAIEIAVLKNTAFKKEHELLERERKVKLICAELNNFTDLKPTLISVMHHIKEIVQCQAISIRLHDEGDYPYFSYDGFPESFIKHENNLCSKDVQGNRMHSSDGKGYLLDCMCGNILKRRFDSSYSFYTEKGSFWSNGTTELFKNTTEEDRQSRIRNYCNSSGYESVALIPIKVKDDNIGLIQINDKRKDLFKEEMIEYLEMIGEQVGLAIQNSMIYTKLNKALNEIKTLRDFIPICASCKSVRNDDGYWKQIELYISEQTGSKFSHGICPDCSKRLYGDFILED